jgi:crossover junction endodeoxyribonuclease RusA
VRRRRMTLTLPYPPSTNTAYAVVRGRKIKTARARQYAHEVAYRVADELRVEHDAWPITAADRLGVTLSIYAPDRRRRDLDNTGKLALDAICAALRVDDSQIDLLTFRRGAVDKANPRLVVRVDLLGAV